MGLSDGILIKDNHIAAVGSVEEAVRRAKEASGPLWRVEVEVKDLDEFARAVAAGAEMILLDNMSVEDMTRAASQRPTHVLLEASGGMTLDRLPSVARTGVDFISMGILTHSARAVDISLEIEMPARRSS
jgi:nicotinate-nucleotide pyrophosphorylase (carboxylating)